MTRDERYMRLALRLAAEARDAGETPVGAVVTLGDRLLSGGNNRRERDSNAVAHAEIEAIRAACGVVGGWRLSGCEMFVTLEPCAMCAGAIVGARMRRVVFGAFDPYAGCMGSLADMTLPPFSPGGIELLGGVLENECGAILQDFFKERRAARN